VSESYEWSGFYGALCARGPRLLEGIDDEIRDIIALTAETDSFWSDGLQSALADGASRGELRSGVLAAVELWRENVLAVLSDDYAIDLDRGSVTVDAGNPVIDELVAAATPA